MTAMLNFVPLQLPQPLGDGDQPVDGEAGDSEAPLPANSWLEQVSEVVVYPGQMSMFANNTLLGGGVRVRVWIREGRNIKGTTKTLMVNLDITQERGTSHISTGTCVVERNVHTYLALFPEVLVGLVLWAGMYVTVCIHDCIDQKDGLLLT